MIASIHPIDHDAMMTIVVSCAAMSFVIGALLGFCVAMGWCVNRYHRMKSVLDQFRDESLL